MGQHILCDFDGTLATYDKFEGPDILGEPVPAMVERVKGWLREGKEVRILTSRIASDGTGKGMLAAFHAENAIRSWCKLNLGCELELTVNVTEDTTEIWSYRSVQIEKNTGKVVGYSTREEPQKPQHNQQGKR